MSEAGDAALMVYCTCPDADTAALLADAAVAESLAACVNQIEGVVSVFQWQGKVERENEVLLIAKTTAARYAALEARWQALHPYELPEVIAVPIDTGSEPYLKWLRSSVTAAS